MDTTPLVIIKGDSIYQAYKIWDWNKQANF